MSSTKQTTLLLGAGTLAREIAMLFGERAWAFVDPHFPEPQWHGIPVYRDFDNLPAALRTAPYIAAVAETALKRRLDEEALAAGHHAAAPLVHENAYVHQTAELGAGTVIYPMGVVSHSAVIGRCAQVSFHCSVAHDVVFGDHVTLSPHVALSGNVRLGHRVFCGTNVAVREKLTIGDDSRVGMGVSLVESLPARTNALGQTKLIKLPLE